MPSRDRTKYEQPSASRRPSGVGPALLAIVVLAALPAAALAVAPNQNTLAEISLLLEHSRRAPRTEARAERTTPTPADHAQRTRPTPARALAVPVASFAALGAPLPGPRATEDSEHAHRALDAMTRSGRAGLPPPAR